MLKRFLAVALALTLCVGASGCGENSLLGKDEAEYSSEISIFSYKPDTLCPILTMNKANIDMLGIVYDGLVALNTRHLPNPCLAESWSSSGDNTQWDINLRKGVKWHDDTDFVPEDVIYTVNQIKNAESTPYAYNVSVIDKIEKTGENSLRITLTKPLANFVNLLYFPVIKSGPAEIDKVNFSPVGTGAYKFGEQNQGNTYYLTKNPQWWGGSVGVETVNVKLLPNADTALYAFGSGNIDMTPAESMDWGKHIDVAASAYTNIETPKYSFLGINHQDPQLEMEELRRAISLVINRKKICDDARMGYGVVANSPAREGWFVCENQTFDLTPNTEMAKKILEEKGWEIKDNVYQKKKDGVVYRADFEILINADNTTRENVAGIISKDLEAFGIKATVNRVPYEEYKKRISEGQYDTFIGSMILSPELDYSTLLGEGNMFNFEDEEFFFVMSDMQKKKGEEEIKAAYAEFINLFEQTNPIVGLYFEDSVMIYSKRFKEELNPTYYKVYSGIDSIKKQTDK